MPGTLRSHQGQSRSLARHGNTLTGSEISRFHHLAKAWQCVLSMDAVKPAVAHGLFSRWRGCGGPPMIGKQRTAAASVLPGDDRSVHPGLAVVAAVPHIDDADVEAVAPIALLAAQAERPVIDKSVGGDSVAPLQHPAALFRHPPARAAHRDRFMGRQVEGPERAGVAAVFARRGRALEHKNK